MDLPQVRRARRADRRLPRFLDRRQQDGDQHSDHADHDQQLDEGERSSGRTIIGTGEWAHGARHLSPRPARARAELRVGGWRPWFGPGHAPRDPSVAGWKLTDTYLVRINFPDLVIRSRYS